MKETNLTQKYTRKCFHCKSDIEINRNGNNNVVYYDGHYYHEQCFKDMNCIKKKCAKCGNDIVIEKKHENNIVLYDKKYYHKNCFINHCEIMNTKKWKTAFGYIDKYIEEADLKITELMEKRKVDISSISTYVEDANDVIKKWFAESDVNKFIIEQYNIAAVGDIYMRYLSKIYNGVYKNLNGTKIPPEHLLDMWKQKMNYLIKVRQKNIVKGKEMTAEQRIAYDLAVLVGKYNQYIEWLNKCAVVENNPITPINDSLRGLDLQKISKQINKTKNKSDDDMDELLDELFE